MSNIKVVYTIICFVIAVLLLLDVFVKETKNNKNASDDLSQDNLIHNVLQVDIIRSDDGHLKCLTRDSKGMIGPCQVDEEEVQELFDCQPEVVREVEYVCEEQCVCAPCRCRGEYFDPGMNTHRFYMGY